MDQGLIHVVAGVLSDASGQVLIAQRPVQVHQGGLWEFPGGKLEPGEDPVPGLKRELREELGIELLASRALIQVQHHYGDRHILLDVHLVLDYQGEPQGREGQPLAWRQPEALDATHFPAADRPVIKALRLPSLVLITPDDAQCQAPDPTDPAQQQQTARFLAQLDHSITAGARLIQLRAHSLKAPAYRALARKVAQRCQAQGVRLVLNRAPEELPEQLPVQGFHLTAARLHAMTEGRRDSQGLLGASCHDARDLARAGELDLDYALLSPVKATQSHSQAKPLGWGQFAKLVRHARLPVYALGGLMPADLPQAWAHGAQGVAAIRGLWPSWQGFRANG